MDAKRYKFFTPTHLVFGEGCSGEVGQRVKALGGTKALLVSDKGLERTGLVGKMQAALEAEGVAVVVYADVSENPTARQRPRRPRPDPGARAGCRGRAGRRQPDGCGQGDVRAGGA